MPACGGMEPQPIVPGEGETVPMERRPPLLESVAPVQRKLKT